MPYKISQGAGKCSGYAVVVSTTGRVVGCHPSRERAERHRRALYANVPEARKSLGLSTKGLDPLAPFERLAEDEGFWKEYKRQLKRSTRPYLRSVFFAGMRTAFLSPEVTAILDGDYPVTSLKLQKPPQLKRLIVRRFPRPDVFLDVGEVVVENASEQWANEVTRTTINALLQIIEFARINSLGPEYILEKLIPLFGEGRAALIAITETNAFFAKGATTVYEVLSPFGLSKFEITAQALAELEDESRQAVLESLERVLAEGEKLLQQREDEEIAAAAEEAELALVQGWRWQTLEDDRVCPECLALNGQVFDFEDSGPPLHPRCRCFPRAYVEGLREEEDEEPADDFTEVWEDELSA